MAGGANAYAAVHARVRAMAANILDQSTWQRLINTPDLMGLVTVLKDTVYGNYVSATDDHALTSRRVAYEIRKRLANDFTVIIHNAPEHVRALLSQIFRLYEVDNLKAVLRGLEVGETYDRIRFMLFPMGRFASLPYEQMADAETIAGAIDVIHHTHYYVTLSHAMDRYNTEKSLFPLEVALDLDYWREIWSDLYRMSPEDKASTQRIIGMVMDNNNLMWAARYRIYHHLSEEEIINYTLPFGYRVSDALIRSIAAGEDVLHRIAEVYPELGDVLGAMRDPQRDLPVFEIHLQRLFLSRCKAAFMGYPFNVGLLLAYLYIIEMEIQDITVLLEAKALDIDISNYQSYLLVSEPEAVIGN